MHASGRPSRFHPDRSRPSWESPLVELAPGNHTLNVQVLKWEDAADSHIDVFADLNGYSTLLWHKVADL